MNERFPLGFWNYQPMTHVTLDDVQKWAECGMTLPMSPQYYPTPENKRRMLEILDECQRNDMRVILCDSRSHWNGASSDPETYRVHFREACEDFASHPAVYGFHIGDEPSRNEMEDVITALAIQKEEAPSLKPFLNLLPTWDGKYIGYDDVYACFDDIKARMPLDQLCYDRYSQMNPEESGTEAYFVDLRRYSELSASMGIPFWTTLLCVGHFRYRVPSEDDLRWQLSTALAAGCKGILWFMFYLRAPISNYRKAPIDMFGERTETFYALKNVLRQFNATYADTFKDLTLDGCYHLGRAWGGYPLFTDKTDDVIIHAESSPGLDAIISFFTGKDGKKYVAIVGNSTKENNHIALTVRKSAGRMMRVGPSFGHPDVQMNFHDEGLKDEGDTFTYYPWLAPGQINLYRFDK
ncbi:MAG: hypothetical protein PUE85_01185 [Firmicutes bacterium]|nr:hypothetical protein [Bacillota bacterium]